MQQKQRILVILSLTLNLVSSSFPNIQQCVQKIQFERQVFLQSDLSSNMYVTDETLLEDHWTHDMHAKSFRTTMNRNEQGRIVMTGFQLLVSAGLVENLELGYHGY